MKYNEFPESVTIADDDILLIQQDSNKSIRGIKASTLKQYIGTNATNPQPIIPEPPKTNLVLWYGADKGITIDSSGNVPTISSWVDGTNLADNNALQNNKNAQPSLIYNSINGKPTIKFDGINDYFYTNGASYPAKLILVVFKVNNFASYDGIITCRNSGNYKTGRANENILLTGVPSTSKITGTASAVYLNGIIQNLNNFNDYRIGIDLLDLNKYHLIEQLVSSSVIGAKYWAIGADTEGGTNSRFLNGNIADILIYSVEDEATRVNARDYLNSKYKIF